MSLNKMIKYVVCILLIFAAIVQGYSQQNKTYFHNLAVGGVPFGKRANVLFEDSIGYLWIGSNNGLYRYDGNHLIHYQHEVFDKFSIPNNNINTIVEDDNQNLWMGSESYLIHFNRAENKFRGYLKNITSKVLHKSKDGNVWVNVGNQGLIKIQSKKNVEELKLPLNINDSVSYFLKYEKDINSFVEDNFNRFWFGTADGIFIINKGINKIQKKINLSVTSLTAFKNNQILVTTGSDFYILGYNKTDYELEVREHYANVSKSFNSNGRLKTLSVNKSNNDIWIGTSNGLLKGERNTNNAYEFSYYSKKNNGTNLLNNQISATTFDSYDNLWVGSLKGVNKHLHRSAFFDYNHVLTPGKEENKKTNCIFYLNNNTTLIGMEDGLFVYDKKENKYTKILNDLRNINKISYNYEKNKLLVAAGFHLYTSEELGEDIHQLSLKKVKSYNKMIMDFVAINKNEIFVALWGGVDVVNNTGEISKFKNRLVNQFKKNHTSVLLLTNENKLWVGTRGEGLTLVDFNNETSKTFFPTKENGLTSQAILSLFEDKHGKIWIGTRGGGVNIYNKETNTFKNFKKHKGQTPKTISAIEGDFSGNIWMSTDDGVTRFNEVSKKFIPFGVEDGIREGPFIFNSSTVNKNSEEVYFGCKGGFYTVYTDKYLQKKVLPSTVITDFYMLGATNKEDSATSLNLVNLYTTPNKPLVLSYDQNNIAVNFSSLDLTTPSKNEYAYKLEGLNDYWIHTTAANRNANYNDLSPGKYTFKVKSTNSDGVWNETPTELNFYIEPPFWKSTLAIVVYILFSFLGMFFAYLLIKKWYGLKQNLVAETVSREKDNEHNRMKMVFFTDISHELRTPLALILGSLEKVVKEKNFTLSPITVQRIYNNTLRMHRLINQVMDIRKFDEGKLKLSISKNDIVKDVMIIKNAFNDFAKIYNIKYDFISKDNEILGWYDVDILEKILFNLLSNAFKYTQQNGEINVNLELYDVNASNTKQLKLTKGNYIKCSVYDNGLGIPEEDLESIFNRYYQSTKPQSAQVPGTGIGMELVQKLIERHHGSITVTSKENVYTKFTFFLPIDQKKYTKEECIEKGAPLKKNFIKNSEYQVIEEVAKEHDAKVNTKSPAKPTVLVVEDNADLRGMIKEELKKDFSVLEASNGKEGYQMALKEIPQLIISDILMPIEDGISMLRRIKENDEINRIPIFMLTAKNSEETKIECLSLGADDFIEKPFSLEFVMWKVKNTLVSRKKLKEKYSKVITAEPSDIKVTSNDEKFIKKLVKIIEDSMSDNTLSVEYLASEAGMSRANLYRKIQHILNDTPVNFIKTIRLKRAAQLLKKDSMYISEVAYMTGFNNQRYFSKCFHKEYGMSPTEYIKQNVNKEDVVIE